MSTEQQLHQALRERTDAITDAWYRTIHASSPAPSSPAEMMQLVGNIARQITGLLLTENCDQERMDALATQLVSLRLPPGALGALQEVLVQELLGGLSDAQMAALTTHPSALIANLTASLLRGAQKVILKEQERIRHAYVDALRQVQREIRSKDATLRQQVDRLQALQQIDRGILAASSAEEIGAAALRHLRELIPCQRASVTLFDLESHQAHMIAAIPPEAFDISLGETRFSLNGMEEVVHSLQREEIHVIDDVRLLPVAAPMREMIELRPPHALAISPLRREGELLGSLNLALEHSEDLTSQHVSIAREVADSLAVAIRQAQLDAAITHHRQQLRALTARLAEIDEAKRRALARALHDQIGQKLTALGINLNVIKAGLDAEQVPQLRSRLDDSLMLLEETTDRVRKVMADLRPPMLDDYGLVPTLHWCGEQLASRTGVHVVVHGQEPHPRLPPSMEDALVRIAQEALTNVAKHANASRVNIALSRQGSGIQLTISDDGEGFDPAGLDRAGSPHWGLLTMTERAEAVGGHCHLESEPGTGTRVVVQIRQ